MKRAKGTRFGPQRLAVLAVSVLALAGCEEGLNLQGEAAPDGEPEASESSDTVELFPQVSSGSQRDVEAPDVFQLTEAGLWDGRPSLGGIWVAHPDVGQPERVLIKNTSNNKTVTGALFRRERDLPGPALQVSSSAASQLGMLAGAPSRLQVVALRREEIQVAPPEAEPEVTEETATEVADSDAAPLDEAEPKPAKRKWWQKKPAEDTGTAAAVTAGAAAGAAVVASDTDGDETAPVAEQTAAAVEAEVKPPAEKPAKRKWWQKKPAEETAAATAAAAVAATEAATEEVAETATQTAALADPEVTPPSEKPKKRKWWQKKDPNEITETPLDPIAGAAAAIEASEPTAAAAPTATAAAATTAAASTSALTKPYVQVGTFGVEANANSAAEKVRRNGMAAQVRELKTEDKTVWRVLVGPADTRAQRRAILSDVKDLGFTDAFTASN